jgi:hypothetical protein
MDAKVGDKRYRYEVLFRVENCLSRRVHMLEFPVTIVTAHGVWVDTSTLCPGRRFIREDGAKERFAWPTKEQAAVSLFVRKSADVRHCERRVYAAEREMECAQELVESFGIDAVVGKKREEK